MVAASLYLAALRGNPWMVREVDISCAANPMLKRYGDKALEESDARSGNAPPAPSARPLGMPYREKGGKKPKAGHPEQYENSCCAYVAWNFRDHEGTLGKSAASHDRNMQVSCEKKRLAEGQLTYWQIVGFWWLGD